MLRPWLLVVFVATHGLLWYAHLVAALALSRVSKPFAASSTKKSYSTQSPAIPLSFSHALSRLRDMVSSHTPEENTMSRFQITLSHAVDPLAWLHAHQHLSMPLVYFASPDDSLQVACLGSVLTLHNTSHVFDVWDELPEESHFYGGQRFDPDHVVDLDDSWKEYKAATWILPALELKFNQSKTTLAIHVIESTKVNDILQLLSLVTDRVSEKIPPTTLPPILTRVSKYHNDQDGQEHYELVVAEALEQIESKSLQKVVLARKQDLHLAAHCSGLDVARHWTYGAREGGHIWVIRPTPDAPEFVGCTPERLFSITNASYVMSEALAGTRPRGTTPQADAQLLLELQQSDKDLHENQLTASYISGVLNHLVQQGWCIPTLTEPTLVVRRLLHLQHICQGFTAEMTNPECRRDICRYLMQNLHPTPAVCGIPLQAARDFIRQREGFAFDRGWYSGPVGYLGRSGVDIVVAIRSGLIYQRDDTTLMSVYAGAGVVPGSTVQGEWAETNAKLGVVSSVFPAAPITLHDAPTPNVAWAAAFVEELIRHGVTRFYICPGSRSTPLVVAVARAVRHRVGVVQAVSVHDERSAAFRALGYGRGTNRPAAVITSSGTAVANLYPAVIEAGMDGVPILLLTADRPYESRDTGSNQAIDQVKILGEKYVRWFRDIIPPTDDVAVSSALSDAAHAVHTSRLARGPVHVNIQFRENLAPDKGTIRNDGRVDSVVKFNGPRFTDAPKFSRWSTMGETFTKFYGVQENYTNAESTRVLISLIKKSRRGIIVVGNLRPPQGENSKSGYDCILQLIADFADQIGFPILAGSQAAALRFSSPAVIPFAEYLLKCPIIAENVKPDLVIQFGSPLVSTEITSIIVQSERNTGSSLNHVLIHPHLSGERADPEYTITHQISSDVSSFLKGASECIGMMHASESARLYSELTPLVTLGQGVADQMAEIIRSSARAFQQNGIRDQLTEPEIILMLSEVLSSGKIPQSLFLSNSMPIRDVESFLYPLQNKNKESVTNGLGMVGSNRGASGIDGIVACALGFAEATETPTTLLIGDLAALHDLTSFHSVANDIYSSKNVPGKTNHPLTTIIVNNDGGGIFSFLPVAHHSSDVGFEEFFGTPTNTLSYVEGINAFGVHAQQVHDLVSLRSAYKAALSRDDHNVIEAKVVGRDTNVKVHREILAQVKALVNDVLQAPEITSKEKLPVKIFSSDKVVESEHKTLLVLHGWMGDKNEWDEVGTMLIESLPAGWSIVAVDLPGHGSSRLIKSSERHVLRKALGLNDDDNEMNVEYLASMIQQSLADDYGIKKVDAIAGYSLGGRVALEMKRMHLSGSVKAPTFVDMSECKLILLSASPGAFRQDELEDTGRLARDKQFAEIIASTFFKKYIRNESLRQKDTTWRPFLEMWYCNPIWGSLVKKDVLFGEIISMRASQLHRRGLDLATILSACSPAKNRRDYWQYCDSSRTLFVSGNKDKKYSTLGREWVELKDINMVEVPDVGHALLGEAPSVVAEIIADFLCSEPDGCIAEPSSILMNDTGESRSDEHLPSKVVSFERHDNDRMRSISLGNKHESEGISTSLTFEAFTVKMDTGIEGGRQPDKVFDPEIRRGFLIELRCGKSDLVGIGEVSPLPGVHTETLDEAQLQLHNLSLLLNERDDVISLNPARTFAFDGDIKQYLEGLVHDLGLPQLFPSVYAGLEMALLGLASLKLSVPFHIAVAKYRDDITKSEQTRETLPHYLPLNGLISRGTSGQWRRYDQKARRFPSLKVKVGHQQPSDDAVAMTTAFRYFELHHGMKGQIRADANRAWNESDAMQFASSLDGIDLDARESIEYIEEPLTRKVDYKGNWSFQGQIEELERWYMHSSIPYAIDESLADLALLHNYAYAEMARDIEEAFSKSNRGCAAFILKPTVLGMELSVQLSVLARKRVGIGAVFTSTFESGVGLAYIALLASLSDSIGKTKTYAHGLGTFSLMQGDTLTPPFGSYVGDNGLLNVASLSRALFGLQIRDLSGDAMSGNVDWGLSSSFTETKEDTYKASTATSSSGKEISVIVSLPLPFSAEIACSRFTDLPQQPRWSPWISSVAYRGAETEWCLNVRGIPLKWRAVSQIVDQPYAGIQWESVSGLENHGIVEFIPDSTSSCHMKVRMTIVPPKLIQPLFQGTSVFLEDFLRDKLLKWSLESFRDVVKADLALERGDVELGDALIGKASAMASVIEATLSMPPASSDE